MKADANRTPSVAPGRGPEWRAVLAAARAGLERHPSPPPSPDPAGAAMDWARVADIARKQRVAPLVYRSVRLLPSGVVPLRDLESLKETYVATAARNAVLFQVLARILGALRRSGASAIVLKGAALAEDVYAERAVRPMNDIDLLVRETDLETARVALSEIGYESAYDGPARSELRARHHHWVFRSSAPVVSGIPLEVHWSLHPPGWPFQAESPALWSRATPGRFADVDALGLAPEDLLLHLCTHAARHRFDGGLLFLCDLAAVACAGAAGRIPLEWRRLEERAREWRSEAYVSVALDLAAELLEAPIPRSTLGRLRRAAGDRPIDSTRERIFEEKGSLRAAAQFRLRWHNRGWRERAAALGKMLSAELTAARGSAGHGRGSSPVLAGARTVFDRYAGWTWSLIRHRREVSAITEREARRGDLESWCSPSRGENVRNGEHR